MSYDNMRFLYTFYRPQAEGIGPLQCRCPGMLVHDSLVFTCIPWESALTGCLSRVAELGDVALEGLKVSGVLQCT